MSQQISKTRLQHGGCKENVKLKMNARIFAVTEEADQRQLDARLILALEILAEVERDDIETYE